MAPSHSCTPLIHFAGYLQFPTRAGRPGRENCAGQRRRGRRLGRGRSAPARWGRGVKGVVFGPQHLALPARAPDRLVARSPAFCFAVRIHPDLPLVVSPSLQWPTTTLPCLPWTPSARRATCRRAAPQAAPPSAARPRAAAARLASTLQRCASGGWVNGGSHWTPCCPPPPHMLPLPLLTPPHPTPAGRVHGRRRRLQLRARQVRQDGGGGGGSAPGGCWQWQQVRG